MEFPEEPVFFSGRLLKHGGVSWKGRFFILTERRLCYFLREGDARPRGYLSLSHLTEVRSVPRRPLALQVVSEQTSLLVSAETEEEVEQWKEAIEARVAALSTPSEPRPSEPRPSDIEPLPSGRSLDAEVHVAPHREAWQVVSAAGQDFEISSKYEMIKPIGHGAYGVVISAIDHAAGTKVAIKKIPETFEDLVDAKRIVREIHLLRHFEHENVISVVDLFAPPSQREDFDDVYIVSDLMETDLHRVIYSKQELTNEHVQFLMYQMLCGLNYIHSAGVIHRDLKPSNILLNSVRCALCSEPYSVLRSLPWLVNCDLKLCDFGLSRGIPEDIGGSARDDRDSKRGGGRGDGSGGGGGGDELTEYVVTRWYRAPEIMLSCDSYDAKIDVWSVACIFAEMLGRKPIFPGNDYIHQLKLIMKLVGRPLEHELGFVTNSKARRFVVNLPEYPKVNVLEKFPELPPAGGEVMEAMLLMDPSRRMSVAEALAHPYFEEVRDRDCEGRAAFRIEWDAIEKSPLTKENLQALLVRDFEALARRRMAEEVQEGV